jgi:hypothetical protein
MMSNYTYYRISLAIFSVIVFSVLLLPLSAHALTISPVRFEISGNPGETLLQDITLVNEGSATETYYTSYSNFEAQGESGSPAFVEAKEGLGTWMSTEESITILPGQQKIIPLKIVIPKQAEPGGNFAVVFFGSTPSGKGVSIGAKTGILVLLSVNGDVKEQAGLVDFDLRNNKHFYKQLPVGFQYRFSNQGGDRVKPVGSVVIRSILGWTVKKVDANPSEGNVLPRTTRKFLPEWSKKMTVDQRDEELTRDEKYSFIKEVKSEWQNFAVGIYRAKVVASFGATAQTVKSNAVYFVVFPWELILVFIVIGIPVYLLLRTMIRRYNRSIIRKAQKSFENNQ